MRNTPMRQRLMKHRKSVIQALKCYELHTQKHVDVKSWQFTKPLRARENAQTPINSEKG